MGRQFAAEGDTHSILSCNLCGSDRRELLFDKKGYSLLRCRDCDLAYIANPPDAEGIRAIYSAETSYHDRLLNTGSDEYRRQRRIARQHLTMLRAFRPDLGGSNLLDIGCSSGIFLDEARAVGLHVRGAELSPDTSAFARDQYSFDVHTGDWRDADYPDQSFDIVTLFDVIEHLPDPLGELRDVRRLLKPGGLLLQSTPDIDGLFPKASMPFAKPLDYWPHPEPPHHLFQFSRKTLSALVEKAGFRVEGARRTAIDLSYNFGTPDHWRKSPKMLAYAALFAPVAIVGRAIGRGDWLYLAATRD